MRINHERLELVIVGVDVDVWRVCPSLGGWICEARRENEARKRGKMFHIIGLE